MSKFISTMLKIKTSMQLTNNKILSIKQSVIAEIKMGVSRSLLGMGKLHVSIQEAREYM